MTTGLNCSRQPPRRLCLLLTKTNTSVKNAKTHLLVTNGTRSAGLQPAYTFGRNETFLKVDRLKPSKTRRSANTAAVSECTRSAVRFSRFSF